MKIPKFESFNLSHVPLEQHIELILERHIAKEEALKKFEALKTKEIIIENGFSKDRLTIEELFKLFRDIL